MQVRWNKKALTQFNATIEYGRIEFGDLVVQKFYRKVIRFETLLSKNPELGAIEPLIVNRRYIYRYLIIHKHYKLIYYIKSDRELRISAIWDTRREPSGLSKSI